MANKLTTQILVISLFLLSANYVFAQVSAQDLGDRICACLETNKGKSDNSRIEECRRTIREDLSEMTSRKRDKVVGEMEIYLQKNCKEYLQMRTTSKALNKGDWETLNSNPPSSLPDSVCRDLSKHSSMYYIQATGDTTYVQIIEDYWKETTGKAKYNTTQKLTWLNNCDFELEFIQSNNPLDNKYFKKGDKLSYRLVEKADEYYIVTASNHGVILKFKLYY